MNTSEGDKAHAQSSCLSKALVGGPGLGQETRLAGSGPQSWLASEAGPAVEAGVSAPL